LISTKRDRRGNILGISINVIIFTSILILLFGIYLGVLIYGENSLTVLTQLKQTERDLSREAQQLKNENQRLQKESFELKQLAAGEE
jgi:cell division protein FtsB